MPTRSLPLPLSCYLVGVSAVVGFSLTAATTIADGHLTDGVALPPSRKVHSAFAGFYSGVLNGTTIASCLTSNPYSYYNCSCPPGTTPSAPIDYASPDAFGEMGRLQWCVPAVASPDFGGGYFETMNVSSTGAAPPSSSSELQTAPSTCLQPNPLLAVPECACPSSSSPPRSGATGFPLRSGGYAKVLMEIGNANGTTANVFVFCVAAFAPSAHPAPYGGLFFTVITPTQLLCASPNPQTDDCSCPPDSFVQSSAVGTTIPDHPNRAGFLVGCYRDCPAKSITDAQCAASPYCVYCAALEAPTFLCAQRFDSPSMGIQTSCCYNANHTNVTVCQPPQGVCVSKHAQGPAQCGCPSGSVDCGYRCCAVGHACCGEECCAPGTECCDGGCCPVGSYCDVYGTCCPMGSTGCSNQCCSGDTPKCCFYNADAATCCSESATCCGGDFSAGCCAEGNACCMWMDPMNPSHWFWQCCGSGQKCVTSGNNPGCQ